MGSLLSTAFSFIAGPLLDKIIGPMEDIWKAYINKQITQAQLIEQIQALMVTALKEIEVAHEQALVSIYQSFMGAVVQSPIMARTWAFVTISQGVMLLWFQAGIPAVVLFVHWYSNPAFRYPSAGTTADWAYLLVGGLCGLGLTMKPTGIASSLKALIGK